MYFIKKMHLCKHSGGSLARVCALRDFVHVCPSLGTFGVHSERSCTLLRDFVHIRPSLGAACPHSQPGSKIFSPCNHGLKYSHPARSVQNILNSRPLAPTLNRPSDNPTDNQLQFETYKYPGACNIFCQESNFKPNNVD